jgi:hypothetical protein
LYYLAIGSLLCVLTLSANTSFVGFPRLCRLIAGDKFLPNAFAIVGRRLVYSIGILFLAATSGLLLVIFKGITDRLIPLFAVGAFGAFTLSQAGMVVHWRRALRDPGASADRKEAARSHLRMGINALGAVSTGAALVVILIAKFAAGAWITVLAVASLLVLFKLTKRHYLKVARKVRTRQPIDIEQAEPPVVLLPMQAWDRPTRKALRFAMWLSPDVIAIHLHTADPAAAERAVGNGDDEDELDHLRRQWREAIEPLGHAGIPEPRLEVISSPYRRFLTPLLTFIEQIKDQHPHRQIAVIIPELVKRRWWQYLLHNFRAERLRAALLKNGGRRMVVVNVPWYVDDEPDPLAAKAAAPGEGVVLETVPETAASEL